MLPKVGYKWCSFERLALGFHAFLSCVCSENFDATKDYRMNGNEIVYDLIEDALFDIRFVLLSLDDD